MMGVAYGMALADVVIGPGIPSASARGGGIMYPIMQSIADAYESKPGPTARRAGAFLVDCCLSNRYHYLYHVLNQPWRVTR